MSHAVDQSGVGHGQRVGSNSYLADMSHAVDQSRVGHGQRVGSHSYLADMSLSLIHISEPTRPEPI
eukprot:5557420-Pyramimonas_sp.AAC.1